MKKCVYDGVKVAKTFERNKKKDTLKPQKEEFKIVWKSVVVMMVSRSQLRSWDSLQDFATLLLCWLWWLECGEDRFIENIFQAFLQGLKKKV